MAENYCDYISGDDDTGDGTNGNPYKTIDKAATGLSGGDEVRVATELRMLKDMQTLTFVNYSYGVGLEALNIFLAEYM